MTDSVPIPILEAGALPDWILAARRPFHGDMYAMFSSEYAGIVTNPLLMTVPVDDHLVHRGDGVFETLKCTDGRIYCYQQHLDRLFYSSEKISLSPPFNREEISRRILETIRAGARRDCLIRVIVSRGPGSMGISPYDCPRANLYVLVHKLLPPFMDTHPDGARVITSAIPVKPGIFATIKSCNYLPNALLKKEAVDGKADFAVNFDEHGFLAEGATENFGIVTPDRVLVVPDPSRILTGTTMKRAYELANSGKQEGWLSDITTGSITRDDLFAAAEVLIFGTTTNVTAVTTLDGRRVGAGIPGPVFSQLSRLILADQTSDGPHTVHAFT